MISCCGAGFEIANSVLKPHPLPSEDIYSDEGLAAETDTKIGTN